MTIQLQVVTEPLGGSPLARAVAAGTAATDWYSPRPTSAEGWRRAMRDVSARFPAGEWLSRLGDAILAQGAAAERLQRVASNGGVLVTTGQQPGLFGGPIYTWTKAISALALADALEEATGVPTAPLFWAATDDADFDEARGTIVAVEGGWERLILDARPPAGTPMSDAPLGDAGALLRRLEAASGSAAFAAALEACRRAYGAPGATVGGAYVSLLRELLAPLSIGVLDASHRAVRQAGAPVLRAAVERARGVDESLRARDVHLRAAGVEPQVDALAGLALVFATERGAKRRLAVGEDGAAHGDDALSPNVLLRPVMERAILPTVAYVAGPGELAYFAQVSAVADALSLDRPLVVPRWSATIVEPTVQRALDRLGVDRERVREPERVAGEIARRKLPDDVRAALQALRASMARDVDALGTVAGGDLVPPAVLEGLTRSIAHRLDRLERRYLAGVKRRETQLMRDLGTASGALYPAGQRQERALNLLPILARHGTALFDAMRIEAARHAAALVGTPTQPHAATAPMTR